MGPIMSVLITGHQRTQSSEVTQKRRPRVGLSGCSHRSYTLAEKLEARIIRQPNGCWDVQGSANRSGHVDLCGGSKLAGGYFRIKAHIFAWQTAHHQSVPSGKVVRHLCHNPRCANPDHLELGTQHDNIQDSVRAGRFTLHHVTGRRLNGQPTKRALRASRSQVAAS